MSSSQRSGTAGPRRLEDPVECLRNLQKRTHAGSRQNGTGRLPTFHQGKLIKTPAFPITPVDTTGAGDSFNAGFLHVWLRGRSIEEALRFATACGALSTRAMGGTGSQATVEEAEAMINAPAGN